MKTTTKTKPDISKLFKSFVNVDVDQNINQVAPVKPTQDDSVAPTMKPRVASRAKTRAKTQAINFTPDIVDALSSIDLDAPDEISDYQARQNAVDRDDVVKLMPSMLPTVISKQLTAAGMVDPEWHMVKHLPGYLASGIRSMGRAVFGPFTKTPIEQIQVLANLGGSGPNETRELNAVASFLQKNAARDTEAEIIFHDKIPNYNADIKIYKALGFTFMLVKDFAGNYIYSWPTNHERSLRHTPSASGWPSLEGVKLVSFKQFLIEDSREDFLLQRHQQQLMSAANQDQSARGVEDPKQLIQAIRNLDPTNGKFLQYLIGRYIQQQFRLEDAPRVRAALDEFLKKRQTLPLKDINQYKSLHDLYDAVETAPDPMASKKQQKKQVKQEGADVILKGPNFIVIRLKTAAAACFYAAGTKWCTSNASTFKGYAKDGDIYVIMVKNQAGDTRKFQFHYQSNQLMDERDRSPSAADVKLLSSFPEWYQFVDMMAERHWSEFPDGE